MATGFGISPFRELGSDHPLIPAIRAWVEWE